MRVTSIVGVLCLCYLGANASDGGFDTAHDDKDIRQVPVDMIRSLLECILDKFPCSEEDMSVKRLYPELVTKACHNCDSDQKININTILNRAEAELPELYAEYKNMFDPAVFKAFRDAIIT